MKTHFQKKNANTEACIAVSADINAEQRYGKGYLYNLLCV